MVMAAMVVMVGIGVLALATTLQSGSCRRLEHLALSFNWMGVIGSRALGESVIQAATVVFSSVNHESIMDILLRPCIIFDMFGHVLRPGNTLGSGAMHNLRTLDLQGNGMMSVGVRAWRIVMAVSLANLLP